MVNSVPKISLSVLSLCLAVLAFWLLPKPGNALEPPPEPEFTARIHSVAIEQVGDSYAVIKFSIRDGGDLASSQVRGKYKRRNPYGRVMRNVHFFSNEDWTENRAIVTGLLPDRPYIIRLQLYSEEGLEQSVKFPIRTAKTEITKISGVSKLAARTGEEIEIFGSGFGNFPGKVRVGNRPFRWDAGVTSWSDTKISAIMPNEASDGPVKVFLAPIRGYRGSVQYTKEYIGPQIDVVDGTNVYPFSCSHGVIADSYEAPYNFDQIYRQEYGRPPKCEEMEFHLQHVTPHDRLRAWLREQEEGIWWRQFKEEYDGHLVYSERTGIFYLKDGFAFHTPAFMTWVAHGHIPDNAKYVESLEEFGMRGAKVVYMYFHEGPRQQKIMKVANRKSVYFKNAEFRKYINANKPLIRWKTIADFDQLVCDYLLCGLAL